MTPETVFSKLCTFERTVTNVKDLPTSSFPEIAFVGRSNVGKSSLLNALCGRTRLARISHTPGRTQALNFFNLADYCYLVDLPGYGYAKAAYTKILEWGKTVEDYLKDRPSLLRVYILVDGRHGLKPLDIWMMDLLDAAAQPYQIVLTKGDKVSLLQQEKLSKDMEEDLKFHPAAHPHVLFTSSRDKKGMESLRKSVFENIFPPLGEDPVILKDKDFVET